MNVISAVRAVNWSEVWQSVLDAIDRMPPERNGMPDHSLDRYLPARPALTSAARRPSERPTPPQPDEPTAGEAPVVNQEMELRHRRRRR